MMMRALLCALFSFILLAGCGKKPNMLERPHPETPVRHYPSVDPIPDTSKNLSGVGN